MTDAELMKKIESEADNTIQRLHKMDHSSLVHMGAMLYQALYMAHGNDDRWNHIFDAAKHLMAEGISRNVRT